MHEILKLIFTRKKTLILATVIFIIPRELNAQGYEWVTSVTAAKYIEVKGMGIDGQSNIYLTGNHKKGAVFYSSDKSNTFIHNNKTIWPYSFIAKYTSEGKLLWIQGIENISPGSNSTFTSIEDISVDPGGNSYITGGLTYSETIFNSSDGKHLSLKHNGAYYRSYVVKYSTSGKILWSKILPDAICGLKIKTDADGNCYILSSHFSYITCLDKNGNLKWKLKTQGIDPFSVDGVLAFETNSRGELFISGKSRIKYGRLQLGQTKFDTVKENSYFLLKIDRNGKPSLLYSLSRPGDEETRNGMFDKTTFINSISFNSQGNPFFAAIHSFQNHTMLLCEKEFLKEKGNTVIAELNVQGKILWHQQFDCVNFDHKFYRSDRGSWILQIPIHNSFKINSKTITSDKYNSEYTKQLVYAVLDSKGKFLWAIKGGAIGSVLLTSKICSNIQGKFYVTSTVCENSILKNDTIKTPAFYLASIDEKLKPGEIINPPLMVSADSISVDATSLSVDVAELPKVNEKILSYIPQNPDSTYTNLNVEDESDHIKIIPDDSFDYQIYPNPTNGLFNIAVTSSARYDIEIRIVEMSGKTVKSEFQTIEPGENIFKIDIAALASGYYPVSIFRNGKVLTKKVVKN